MHTIINAKNILLQNKRIDLISKFTYIKKNFLYNTEFYKDLYCAFIQAFNGFCEKPSKNEKTKIGKEAFINSFDELYNSIKTNGFDESKAIPVYNNELCDGAHRFAICCALDINIPITQADKPKYIYDYKFFKERNINETYLDYCALEFVKMNTNSYIVNLHATNDIKKDKQVEEILNKYGYIYYKKDIWLNYNGYVNIKKLSYGSDNWGKESWIGTSKNNYKGAQRHAKKSYGDGKNPLRAYVFICDNIDKVIQAKAEIREIFKIGNESVHINDSRQEAIELAQTYFNNNSINFINSRPFNVDTFKLDDFISELKSEIKKQNVDIDEICASGSSPLAAFAIREIKDLDYIYCGNKSFTPMNNDISEHEGTWLQYYQQSKDEIINNPKYHFYYKGIKFITLEVLKQMKLNRNEVPKDVDDVNMINKFLSGSFKVNKRQFKKFHIIKKEK